MRAALLLMVTSVLGCDNAMNPGVDGFFVTDLASVADLSRSSFSDLAQDKGPFGDPVTGNFGRVTLISAAFNSGTTPIKVSAAGASFDVLAGGTPANCNVSKMGNCYVGLCSGGTTSTPTAESAGNVTVTGALNPVTLTYTAGTGYGGYNGSGVLWNGGETLTFNAAGAAAPAFSTTVIAPTELSFLTPTFPQPGSPLTINRANDFVLTWTPAGSSTVTLTLSGDAAAPNAFLAICSFPSAAGTATIPKEALALETGTMGAISLDVANSSVPTQTGFLTKVTASTYPLAAGQNASGFTVQFQ